MKALRLKAHHFHTKLPFQKPMLKQIKWWLQNGTITKNRDLPVTTLFFWKFCFTLRTCYTEFIFCTNNPNAHICTFCKCWSFIWRCFFPVSILKIKELQQETNELHNNCKKRQKVNNKMNLMEYLVFWAHALQRGKNIFRQRITCWRVQKWNFSVYLWRRRKTKA